LVRPIYAAACKPPDSRLASMNGRRGKTDDARISPRRTESGHAVTWGPPSPGFRELAQLIASAIP